MMPWPRIIWGLSLVIFVLLVRNFSQLEDVASTGTASDVSRAEDAEEADVMTDGTAEDLDSEERGDGTEDIHICICSDDIDLRPAAAAIRSTMASASQPHRLVFHYITSPELASQVRLILRKHLAGVRLHVHHDAQLQSRIAGVIDFRESSGARQSLASAFNFAPFYLQEYLSGSTSFDSRVKRLIYMDADIIVLGDVTQLIDFPMHGHSCAAVQYCEQRLKHYINFTQLGILGMTKGLDPDACIANRGFFVVDVQTWKDQRITEKIESWLQVYSDSLGDLWFGGMSQPPWLMALEGKNYARLGQEWNCNGLGRSAMNEQESRALFKDGYTKDALKKIGASVEWGKVIVPYVGTCTTSAKLLHFNGAMKPWFMDSSMDQQPVCAMPQAFPSRFWKHPMTTRIYGTEKHFVLCSEIWAQYIEASTLVVPDTSLQEFFKTRKADEVKWAHQLQTDMHKKEQKAKEHKAKNSRSAEELAAKFRRRKGLAGGFVVGQIVSASAPIVVRGQVVVVKGIKGVVLGPAVTNPLERVHVVFKNARRTSINVVPAEVKGLAAD